MVEAPPPRGSRHPRSGCQCPEQTKFHPAATPAAGGRVMAQAREEASAGEQEASGLQELRILFFS